MIQRVRWHLFVVVLVLLGAAACGDDGGGGPVVGDDAVGAAISTPAGGDDGGDEGSEQGGDEGDGCELVTEADGESILGEPVVRMPSDGLGDEVLLAECAWGVESDVSFKLLQLHVFDGAQFFTPDVYAQEAGFEEIEGLGDEAFLLDLLGLQVQVLDGDRTIVVDVSGFNVDDFDLDELRTDLIDLAGRVLERS